MIERTLPAPTPPPSDAIAAGPNDLHELRVRIPLELHRQLLSLKILRGRSLAETVSLALDIYFQQRAAEQAPAQGGAAAARGET